MITLDELKRYLWIEDNSQDVLLQEIIDWVTAYIESYTWRNLSIQDYDKKYNWNWERIFILPNFPVNSITEIKYRNNTDFSAPTYTLIETKDYSFNTSWEIFFNFNLIRWFNVLEIKYNAWYDPIPEDLKLACKMLCWLSYNTKNTNWVKSESVEWVSIVFSDTSSETIKANIILDNYKNYV